VTGLRSAYDWNSCPCNPNPGFIDSPVIGVVFALVTVLLIWAALSSKNN